MEKNIAIAGAGIMGASLAQIYAQHGYRVYIYDIAPEGIEKGKALIGVNQENSVRQGDLTGEQSEKLLSRISFSTQMKDTFPQAQFVIEAIVERLPVKHSFWEQASEMVAEDAILTSNTSGLSITEIAKAVRKPERFCGMHWVNPPHIVPLVEVIKGEKTGEAAAQAVYENALSVKHKPVMIHKDPRGFCLNRIQFSVLREAMNIVEQGYASIEDVDNVLKYGLGMRYAAIGPFETVDLGGIDTFYNVAKYLFADLSDAKTVSPMLADLYDGGNLGVKTGKGFYDYSDGKDVAAITRRDTMFLKLSKCLFEEKEEK